MSEPTRAGLFDRNGFVTVRGLLAPVEIEWYRALIVNFRPQAMVDLERERGFDHGKDAPGPRKPQPPDAPAPWIGRRRGLTRLSRRLVRPAPPSPAPVRAVAA
jgi:hypothetical protein